MYSKVRSTIRGLFNVRRGRASYKEIRRRVAEGASIDGIHLCQLIAAMIIASIGLNVDSTEAIIGAMLICPIMGSVLAFAYAIASIDRAMLKEASIGLLVQIAVCLCTSTLYFIVSPLSHATSELLSNSTATIWDVLVAFVGGFAGALGTSRRQEPTTLIAGVAVATALMPPLCSAGYGIAMRDMMLAASALYEFLINVVFIAFGAELVLVWLKVPLQTDLDGDGVVTDEEISEAVVRSKAIRRHVLIISLLIAVPCLFISARVVRTTMDENGTLFETVDMYQTEMSTLELKAVCPEFVSYHIGQDESYDIENDRLEQRIVATIVTSSELDAERQKQLEKLIRLNVEQLDEVEFEVAKQP